MPESPDRGPFARGASCFDCQARHRSRWAVLTAAELDLLNQSKVPGRYRSRDAIFREGMPCQGIHCIHSGTVSLKRSGPRGGAGLTRVCSPGETLGYGDYFRGRIHSETAEAVTDCQVCFIDREALQRLLAHNPSLGHQFLVSLSEDVEKAERELLVHRSLPVRARLAHLMLVLKDRFDSVDERGNIVLELPLSRTDMASLIGARPESLSRAIRELETDGIARFEPATVVIPDLDLLLDEIERGPGA